MRNYWLSLILLLAIPGCVASEPESSEVAAVPDDPGIPAERAAATEAANGFLARIDKGEISEVWPELSVVMTESVRRSDWERSIAAMRQDIGNIEVRRLTEIGFTDGLGDIPKGRYYILHFVSDFDRATVTEELTVSLENGLWRVGGYFASDIKLK